MRPVLVIEHTSQEKEWRHSGPVIKMLSVSNVPLVHTKKREREREKVCTVQMLDTEGHSRTLAKQGGWRGLFTALFKGVM